MAAHNPPEARSINYMDDIVAKRISKANWIRMALNDPDYGQPAQITLAHMVGDQPKEIHSLKIIPGLPRDPDEIAKLFDDRAAYYCQDLPGAQTFNIIVFYGEGASIRQQALPFTKTGAGSQIGILTESPDERGKTQMGMRHVEMLGSGYFRGNQIALETLASIIREQREDNRGLRRDVQEAWGVVRQVMLDTVEIQHKHRMEELKFQRASEDRKMIMRMLPAVINEATGKQILPQSTVDSTMMDAVVERMTPEQLKFLTDNGMIPPEVAGFLAKRMAEKMKEREQAAQADSKAKEVTSQLVTERDIKPEDEIG